MGLEQNLALAKAAFDYATKVFTKGASNRDEDLAASRERAKNAERERLEKDVIPSWAPNWVRSPVAGLGSLLGSLGKEDLKPESYKHQRDEIAKEAREFQGIPEPVEGDPFAHFQPRIDPFVHMLTAESFVLESGIGNCGEQAGMVFLFLTHQYHTPKFCMANIGRNHQLVIIGVDEADVNDAYNNEYSLEYPPNWPDAVICDPWHRKYFPVVRDWTEEIPEILKKTEPENRQRLVKVVPICSHVWRPNPGYEPKVLRRKGA